MRASLLLVSALVLLAAVLGQGALVSDRNYLPSSWVRLHRADPEHITTFSVFLKQRNVRDTCPTLLDQISDPESPDFAKHLTREQILDRLAPSEDVQRQVIEWVKSAGIPEANINNYRDSLLVRATVRQVEQLFSTELHVYRRLEGKRTIVRQWGTAHVADEVMQHIDLFTGLDDFPPPPRKLRTRPLEEDSLLGGADSGYVIPDTIRRIYKIPYTVATNPKSSVCLAEFQDDASFSAQDLTYFQTQTGEALNRVTKIVGPYNPSSPDAEASLDVQYAAAIADNTTVWYWTVTGWMLDFSQAFFNTKDVPLVVSMSWGWTENHQCDITNCNSLSSKQYVDRVNTEWCKIGLRGVSLFAASGDQGAPGDGDYDCSSSTDPLTPIFPGASPYVTSVGATMLVDTVANSNSNADAESQAPLAGQSKRATPPICQQFQCASVNTEGVCSYPDALITTGGGFSVYSPRPAWQSVQVSAYLNSGVALPPSQFYAGQNRGFPDISALGHNYIIRLGGSWEVVDGTSCSSPVWAAITALLNDARLNAGKAPLGFIAPIVYRLFSANAAAFTSIPKGNNKCTESCCASVGFEAWSGWDPVTGLGTPIYPTLLKYVMNLP